MLQVQHWTIVVFIFLFVYMYLAFLTPSSVIILVWHMASSPKIQSSTILVAMNLAELYIIHGRIAQFLTLTFKKYCPTCKLLI